MCSVPCWLEPACRTSKRGLTWKKSGGKKVKDYVLAGQQRCENKSETLIVSQEPMKLGTIEILMAKAF